jgi:hypothetical protein
MHNPRPHVSTEIKGSSNNALVNRIHALGTGREYRDESSLNYYSYNVSGLFRFVNIPDPVPRPRLAIEGSSDKIINVISMSCRINSHSKQAGTSGNMNDLFEVYKRSSPNTQAASGNTDATPYTIPVDSNSPTPSASLKYWCFNTGIYVTPTMYIYRGVAITDDAFVMRPLDKTFEFNLWFGEPIVLNNANESLEMSTFGNSLDGKFTLNFNITWFEK